MPLYNYKAMMILADMIKGEINRMCVTNDMIELNNMAAYARKNIDKLYEIGRFGREERR